MMTSAKQDISKADEALALHLLDLLRQQMTETTGVEAEKLKGLKTFSDADYADREVASNSIPEWVQKLAMKILQKTLTKAGMSQKNLKKLHPYDLIQVVASFFGIKNPKLKFSREGIALTTRIRKIYRKKKLSSDQIAISEVKRFAKNFAPAPQMDWAAAARDMFLLNMDSPLVASIEKAKKKAAKKVSKKDRIKSIKMVADLYPSILQWAINAPATFAEAKEHNIFESVAKGKKLVDESLLSSVETGKLLSALRKEKNSDLHELMRSALKEIISSAPKEAYPLQFAEEQAPQLLAVARATGVIPRYKYKNGATTYTLDELKQAASKFKTRKEWATKENRTYLVATRFGMLEECCAHMPKRVPSRKRKKVEQTTSAAA